MSTKKQGDVGVAMAIAHYVAQGFTVCYPLTDAARYDLVIDNGILSRVQVKTCNYQQNNSYKVQLKTCGGNKSGSGKYKKLDATEFDILFVYCLNGDRYEFPASFVDGKAQLTLSSDKELFKV